MDDPRLPAIQQVIEPLAAERGMELVEFTCRPQGGQLYLRLLVDRSGGVTIQQCAQLNQLVGQALEAAGLIEEPYTIEVSSPGLDRPFKNHRDYERAIGEDVRLTMHLDDGRVKELDGMLLAVQRDAIVLKTISGNITVPLAQVRLAKKAVRW